MSCKLRLKRFTAFLVIALFSLVCVFGKEKAEHYSDIESIFLTDQQYAGSIGNSSRDMAALESSVHFLLDYMDNPNMRISCMEILKGLDPKYIKLDKAFLKMAPYLLISDETRSLAVKAGELGSINIYIDCLLNSLKTPGGSFHEQYTHKGWRYYDAKSDAEGESKIELYGRQWYGRQYIYQTVVNELFKFGVVDENLSIDRVWRRLKNYGGLHVSRMNPFDRYAYTVETKSSSFAAIIYYVHILSDIEYNSDRTSGSRISLDKLSVDLENHIIKVFGEKKYYSDTLKNIRTELNINKNFAGSNASAQMAARNILDAFRKEFAWAIEDEGFYKSTQLKKDLDKIQGKYQ